MFLFSGRGYWQELIESIVWAHNKIKVAPAIQPRALSITQGRAVELGGRSSPAHRRRIPLTSSHEADPVQANVLVC